MIRTLGIPVLNRGDLLMRGITSIDHPIETLFIINNGNDTGVISATQKIQNREIENEGLFENIRIEKHRNLGCGPSWNHVMKNSEGPWLFAGSDVKFLPGMLAMLDRKAEEHPDASIVCGNGYNVFLLTKTCIDKVGYFDENFYPAYFEDVDHFRRVALSGAKAVGVDEFKCIHGEPPFWGSSTVKSDAEYDRKNGITFSNNQDYYIRKWGGYPADEKYRTPFNKEVGLHWWELDAEMRQKNDIWNS